MVATELEKTAIKNICKSARYHLVKESCKLPQVMGFMQVVLIDLKEQNSIGYRENYQRFCSGGQHWDCDLVMNKGENKEASHLRLLTSNGRISKEVRITDTCVSC